MIFFGAGELCVTDTSDFFAFVIYKYISDDLTTSSGVGQPRHAAKTFEAYASVHFQSLKLDRNVH